MCCVCTVCVCMCVYVCVVCVCFVLQCFARTVGYMGAVGCEYYYHSIPIQTLQRPD